MIIITGGAGFIGSAMVWGLNQRGIRDILVVDDLNDDSRRNEAADTDQKERNVAPLQYERLIGIDEFRQQLAASDWDTKAVEAVIHLGASSYTTEQDWNYLAENNVAYTQEIIRWCVDRRVRCVYASSAATYGDGSKGFSDDHDLFDALVPMNLYGKSKLEVDIWARDAGYLDDVVGLRYFNVFGPNEYHKEHQRSVIAKKFPEVQEKGYIELFKSDHPDYGDGEQERDFIYVKDVVAATLFFLDNSELGGVYNVGTGQARTWNDVAQAMFAALGKEADIRYVDLPNKLKGQYQYHTQADILKLKAAGYTTPLTSLEEAIADYIRNYLVLDRHLGEET